MEDAVKVCQLHADTRPDASNGSRLYELNLWMRRYFRGQERKVSILTLWRRGQGLFARRGQGPARWSSAGGWPLGTAPLRTRRRDSRWFASCFAPIRASCSREQQLGQGRDQP